MTQDTTVTSRAKEIMLVGFDVDGVLTPGDITLCDSGEQIKSFNVKDGLGLKLLERAGIHVCIITARQSSVVQHRSAELGLKHVYQGVKNKIEQLNIIAAELNVDLKNVAYMGDDLPDLSILNKVGLATCPSDAVAEVKSQCHWQSTLPGGKGAARELCSMILSSQNKLDAIVDGFK